MTLQGTAPPEYWVPFTIPGRNPVIAVPGETPRFPWITVLPVLVTVDAPRMAKSDAAPRMPAALECDGNTAESTRDVRTAN